MPKDFRRRALVEEAFVALAGLWAAVDGSAAARHILRPMTTYPLSDTDREIQERARRFVDDELIPWEVHAEEHAGTIPEEDHRRLEQRARDLGLSAMNLPKDLGGGGFTTVQQVLVSEQIGRVTNALGWCVHTPAEWAPEVMTDEQIERWLKPAIRGERSECYAITEAGGRSRR